MNELQQSEEPRFYPAYTRAPPGARTATINTPKLFIS